MIFTHPTVDTFTIPYTARLVLKHFRFPSISQMSVIAFLLVVSLPAFLILAQSCAPLEAALALCVGSLEDAGEPFAEPFAEPY